MSKRKVEQALRAADRGEAYHWPTIAAILADEVRRLRGTAESLRGLSDAATQGEWTYDGMADPYSVRAWNDDGAWTPEVCDAGFPADAHLIAAAVNYVRRTLGSSPGVGTDPVTQAEEEA